MEQRREEAKKGRRRAKNSLNKKCILGRRRDRDSISIFSPFKLWFLILVDTQNIPFWVTEKNLMLEAKFTFKLNIFEFSRQKSTLQEQFRQLFFLSEHIWIFEPKIYINLATFGSFNLNIFEFTRQYSNLAK